MMWMRRSVAWGVVYTLLVGCFFDPSGGTGGDSEDDTGSSGTTSSSSTVSASSSAPSTSASDPSATANPETGSQSSTETSDTTPTSSEASDTGEPPLEGCPEQLPDGWILCEGFEDIPDPGAHFSLWSSPPPGERFAIDSTQAHDGEASLLAQHDTDWFSGAAWIRFGEGPMVTPYSPRARFEEVWVRMHLLLEDGWDVGGLGDLVEVNSLGTNWAHAMSASIDAPSDGDSLRARARTCVSGGVVQCDGQQDWQSLQELGNDPGETALFDGSASGQWHCIVMHVRLNTPGMNDGLLEVSLDGQPEATLDDLDFVGTIDDAGLNAIHLSAYREGGPPDQVRRYVDDIVVADVPLDCG
jgi:hypothetical protein